MTAWSRGDTEVALTMFHPEVEWRLAGIFPDFTGTVRGHAGVLEFWRSFTEPWERIAIEPEEFIEVGDRIVVALQFHAEGRSGVHVDMPQAHVCGFRDGLVCEYRSFRSLDEALAFARGS